MIPVRNQVILRQLTRRKIEHSYARTCSCEERSLMAAPTGKAEHVAA